MVVKIIFNKRDYVIYKKGFLTNHPTNRFDGLLKVVNYFKNKYVRAMMIWAVNHRHSHFTLFICVCIYNNTFNHQLIKKKTKRSYRNKANFRMTLKLFKADLTVRVRVIETVRIFSSNKNTPWRTDALSK